MPEPKNITEETTLAELREQRLLLGVIAIRLVPSVGRELHGPVEVSVHHATGFYIGAGPTEAAAIEAAFGKLRRTLLPEALRQIVEED